MGRYKKIITKSIEKLDAFWCKAAEGIDWYRKWDQALDQTRPPFYRWFAGGELNTCYNALDRHVERGRVDFKYLFLAGERLDPDTYHWAAKILKRPVIDHWWQTETGWPIACYRETATVKRLPKTRSGKILRGTMRVIASGREYRRPPSMIRSSWMKLLKLLLKWAILRNNLSPR